MRLLSPSRHLTVLMALSLPLFTMTAPTKALPISDSPVNRSANADVKHNDGRIVLAQNRQVNGRNVVRVEYPGGSFIMGSGGNWTERNRDGQFRFREQGRDDWSVYLYDRGRDVYIQLDLHRKEIFYNQGGQQRRVLYRIQSAQGPKGGGQKKARNNTCQQLRGRVSQNSNQPVRVTFVNRSGEYRSAMWINFQGQPIHYADIQPGASYTIDTYVTHPWMFVDGPGNCIEMFMPRRGVNRFDLTARSRGFGPE
ncbi:hypothetical protein [uncultured Cohaesibacter sp.]|uniref:VHL beta domain-containing protein n=1 Tax=uncultured Cohaesibacter sp. TaxID=1002546 RepID=UPI0029C6526A|nr:hypothetical protein [uncultured Cohaesibacter sp.]